MTLAPSTASGSRFQLNRAGVLNVWQYDEQIFDFQGGRLLLRGTNGAGKSKTLELLLPFCIDGDRQRMNATGRAQTALTWLMLDGVEEKLRTPSGVLTASNAAVEMALDTASALRGL